MQLSRSGCVVTLAPPSCTSVHQPPEANTCTPHGPDSMELAEQTHPLWAAKYISCCQTNTCPSLHKVTTGEMLWTIGNNVVFHCYITLGILSRDSIILWYLLADSCILFFSNMKCVIKNPH